MKSTIRNLFSKYIVPNAIIWVVLILGISLVTLRPLEPYMERMPGSLEDARFNNYVLEHFLKWVMGQDKSFWSAPIFYPLQMNIAFSDSLLGSAPFYTLFRWLGFDGESAFQGWYVLGFILNYLAAVYVLSKMKFSPLAISAGAFFFTFGLPMLAQVEHAQLVYRFGVPLTAYFLWEFARSPQLSTLTKVVFWFVWQIYLSIYIGFFLLLYLVPVFCLLAAGGSGRKISHYLLFWHQRVKEAWINSNRYQRIANVLGIIGLFAMALTLMYPYFWVSSHYGFSRSWQETSSMLPRVQSFFLSDGSQIWHSVSQIFPDLPMRQEHQLFLGLAVTILIIIGIFRKTFKREKQSVHYHLWAACFLILLTLNFNDVSLYQLLYSIPGFDSIRAVSRIILVIMWPIAILITAVIDQLLSSSKFPAKYIAYLCFGMMAMESILFAQHTFSKVDNIQRINYLRTQVPQNINQDSILFFATNQPDNFSLTEIDAMLLGQEMNVNIMNGYSGNFPPGYGEPALTCKQMRRRISGYLKLTGQVSEKEYQKVIKRIVPIGLTDCAP